MRYAIVSDVHANLPAWKAVLADLTSLGAQRIICLGDVVGYGPQPAEVLASVYEHVDALVMGNHDAVVCGKMTPDLFNHQARFMIEWSAPRVSRRGKSFLGGAPLSLAGDGFTCVHGELGEPGAFRYLVGPEDTRATWAAGTDPLCFVGHTHCSGLFVLGPSGVPHPLPPEDFVLEEGKRYIVNVGSVGYPRDGDPRAGYALFDTDDATVRFRRVPFDYEALRLAVQAAGLAEQAMPLLNRDPLRLRQPVREQLEFMPADSQAQMAHGVTASRDLAELQKSNRRWRRTAVTGILATALLAGVASAVAVHRATTGETARPEVPLPPREAVIPADLAGNLLPAFPPAMPEAELTGWRYRCSHRSGQRLAIEQDATAPTPRLRVVHDRRASLILEAPAWRLNGAANGRLRAVVNARRGTNFVGTVKVVVEARETGAAEDTRFHERVVLNFDLPLKRPEVWEETRRIMDIRKPPLTRTTAMIRYRIEADFIGILSLADPSLTLN